MIAKLRNAIITESSIKYFWFPMNETRLVTAAQKQVFRCAPHQFLAATVVRHCITERQKHNYILNETSNFTFYIFIINHTC